MVTLTEDGITVEAETQAKARRALKVERETREQLIRDAECNGLWRATQVMAQLDQGTLADKWERCDAPDWLRGVAKDGCQIFGNIQSDAYLYRWDVASWTLTVAVRTGGRQMSDRIISNQWSGIIGQEIDKQLGLVNVKV